MQIEACCIFKIFKKLSQVNWRQHASHQAAPHCTIIMTNPRCGIMSDFLLAEIWSIFNVLSLPCDGMSLLIRDFNFSEKNLLLLLQRRIVSLSGLHHLFTVSLLLGKCLQTFQHLTCNPWVADHWCAMRKYLFSLSKHFAVAFIGLITHFWSYKNFFKFFCFLVMACFKMEDYQWW